MLVSLGENIMNMDYQMNALTDKARVLFARSLYVNNSTSTPKQKQFRTYMLILFNWIISRYYLQFKGQWHNF